MERKQHLNQIILDYETPLRRFAGRFVSEQRAQEVVQETFIKLYKADLAEIENRVGEWLYTVCRNQALDVIKKDKRITWWGASEEMNVRDEALNPLEKILDTERQKEVKTVIDSLTERQRHVITLKFQEGLSYKEISDVTGFSGNYVGVLIHSAMLKLRLKLDIETDHEREDHVHEA